MGKLRVENVADVLKRDEIVSPVFPFLSVVPEHFRAALFQPVAVVEASASRVGPKDRGAMAEKMLEFMNRAALENIDIAACPEYSCPWSALCDAVEQGITPPVGKLWAIACESASIEEFEAHVAKLRVKIKVIFDGGALQQHGDFLDALCYLFKTKTAEGQDLTVALIQFKTAHMGDKDHFEYSHLKVGDVLYRFQNPAPAKLGVVTLLCSDALNADFGEVTNQLRIETLILHLQFNLNPVAETFRKYRIECCTYKPRNTEILCLNWGRGTELEMVGKENLTIRDPRTALYRMPDELVDTDERIHENHAKGCFLTYWKESYTSTLVFAPDEYNFCFETTKPYVEGNAQAAVRAGPRMLSLRKWNDAEKSWKDVSDPSDHFETYVKSHALTVYEVLSPLWSRPLDAERLMQLQNALNVLKDIQANHSLDSGLSDFFSKHFTAIQKIFSRIHAPNELRLAADHSGALERIFGDTFQRVSVGQISTGQRAAFVLSIFSMLNLSLRNAPPIMLIDDPIAHVDDINCLSYLDFIADVAESGRRQIFFATANEKLGNIFEKKLGYLDDGLRVIDMR